MIAWPLTLLLWGLGAAPGSRGAASVSVLGIETLRTPFRIVEERLGGAPLARHPAEGSVSPVVRCYFAGGVYLLIESGAAGGYGTGVTTGIELTTLPPKDLLRSGGLQQSEERGVALCSPSPAIEDAHLPRGLELGAARRGLLESLGPPTEVAADTVRYVRDDRGVRSPGRGEAPPAWTETFLWFRDDRLAGVRVRQSSML